VRELLEEYVPRVYRLALRLTGDAHAAEDLTQETLLRAWRQLDRLRASGSARVWLFRIAANLWRDQLRRGRSPVARAGKLADDLAGRCVPPDRTAADHEAVGRALEVMETLPPRQRQVLYLNACEGLSAAEAAEVLGISSSAAKASLSLARKRLRHELRDLLEGLSLPGEC
jgi:RNA polymerase sigma-70 factor (ECF subfamily)